MPSEAGYHYLLDYMKCPQAFYWKYIANLVPIKQPRKALFGKIIHKVLAELLSGELWQITCTARWEELMRAARHLYDTDETYDIDRERGIDLLNNYMEKYGSELIQDKHNNAVASYFIPKFFNIEKQFSMKTPAGFTITGQLDAMVDFPYLNNKIAIMDHKTTSWSLTSLIDTLEVTNQATVYIALAKQNGYLYVQSVIFNILYQNQSSIKFSRPEVYHTQSDIDRFMHQADIIFQAIMDHLNKPVDDWLRNETSCFSFGRRCEYLDLCRGDSFQALKSNFRSREEAEAEELEW